MTPPIGLPVAIETFGEAAMAMGKVLRYGGEADKNYAAHCCERAASYLRGQLYIPPDGRDQQRQAALREAQEKLFIAAGLFIEMAKTIECGFALDGEHFVGLLQAVALVRALAKRDP